MQPETTPPDEPRPKVSVLVTTYNRSSLLKRALGTILMQDYQDYEIVVVDDQSPDDTPEIMAQYDDPRIRYIRNAENMAKKGGDRSIFQRFVNEQARGDYFLWLCDDDYWLPSDLLSRQVRIMEDNPNVAMVVGGMVQLYPTPVKLMKPNRKDIVYSHVGNREDLLFWGNIYPDGLLPSETFLRLFAEDPGNRNIITGGTMFRMASFKKADAFAHGKGVRWQSGYLMLAGTATMGDVWYLDEPCIVAMVELESASYRGTQLDHMRDCLASIRAAFETVTGQADQDKRQRLIALRQAMQRSVFRVYLLNKISYRMGGFEKNALSGIGKIFNQQIRSRQFFRAMREHGVPLSGKERIAVRVADLPPAAIRGLGPIADRMLPGRGPWWIRLLR